MRDTIWFYLVVVGIPVISGCAYAAFERWTKLKEKQLRLATDQSQGLAAEAMARAEALEQRVQVLERIVTDRAGRLSDEIERLRG